MASILDDVAFFSLEIVFRVCIFLAGPLMIRPFCQPPLRNKLFGEDRPHYPSPFAIGNEHRLYLLTRGYELYVIIIRAIPFYVMNAGVRISLVALVYFYLLAALKDTEESFCFFFWLYPSTNVLADFH